MYNHKRHLTLKHTHCLELVMPMDPGDAVLRDAKMLLSWCAR